MSQNYQPRIPTSPSPNSQLTTLAAHLTTIPSRIIATILGLSTAAIFIIPPCYRNYSAFVNLGPGAVPRNPLGWAVQWIFKVFFSHETLSTALYDEPWSDKYTKAIPERHAELNRTSFLPSDLPQRKGDRPVIAPFGAPQREQYPVKNATVQDLQTSLLPTLAAAHPSSTHVATSALEGHFPALYLTSPIPIPWPARTHKREICHMHVPADNSSHVTLSYADAKTVIQRGWGERHPLCGSAFPDLGFGYVMVYAPRDQEEVKVLETILKAGVKYCTALA